MSLFDLPPDLDTDDHILFAGATGRQLLAMAQSARNGDINTLKTMLDNNPDLPDWLMTTPLHDL